MITNMNHTSFTVSNLQESVDFYQNVLGLELISLAKRDREFSSAVSGVKDAELNIAYMKAPNCSIELIEYTSGVGERLNTRTCNIGSAHVCFNVEHFDEFIEHLKKHHVRFRGELCLVPEGPNKGKKVCYTQDNDGNNLEFIAAEV